MRDGIGITERTPTGGRRPIASWRTALIASILRAGGRAPAFLHADRFVSFFQLRSQLDHYAIEDMETVEGLLYFDAAGHLLLHEDYHNHPDSKLLLERLLEVRGPMVLSSITTTVSASAAWGAIQCPEKARTGSLPDPNAWPTEHAFISSADDTGSMAALY